MSINLSDFTLNEIVHVNKGYLEGIFFKIHVENKDYVILITRVGAALIDIEVYNVKHQIDEKCPIEQELISFNEQFDVCVDFFNPESYYHDLNLGNRLEKYEFELSVIKDETIDYLYKFYENENLIMLICNNILYKNLKNPKNIFEKKFGEFLLEICLDRINDNEDLVKNLMDIKVKKEKEKKELDEHMKYVEKKQRRLAEKYSGVNFYSGERRVFNADKLLR